MTTGLSSTAANKLLDNLVRGVTYTPPTAVYIKLHTNDPGAAGTSNPASNTTRAQATFSPAAANGSVVNWGDINWTSVSAAETYSCVSFWDASSGGNYLGSDNLETARGVAAGDNFTISSGQCTLSLTPIAA